jgi:hypothetical protein
MNGPNWIMGSVFVPLAMCMDTALANVQFNLSKSVRVSNMVVEEDDSNLESIWR